MMVTPQHNRGYTYVELLLAAVVAGVLVLGLTGVVGQALHTGDVVHERNELTRQANFAMQRMLQAVANSRRLLLPLNDNPNTNWPEDIREQTVPASPPIGSSTLATAVLAVTLPETVDLDGDGVADADNDGDGLIDEDLSSDSNLDAAPGLYLIDDNGDGVADNSSAPSPDSDNDEDDKATEETLNGLDDDGDGSIDEDLAADMSRDGKSGLIGVDDDGDGNVDESNKNDDDEDGSIDEDGYDSLAFYLDGDVLQERTPTPWDEDNSGTVDGRDFIISPIAGHVTRFRVERIPASGSRTPQVDLTLELTGPVSGETVRLQTRVRLGRAL